MQSNLNMLDFLDIYQLLHNGTNYNIVKLESFYHPNLIKATDKLRLTLSQQQLQVKSLYVHCLKVLLFMLFQQSLFCNVLYIIHITTCIILCLAMGNLIKIHKCLTSFTLIV